MGNLNVACHLGRLHYYCKLWWSLVEFVSNLPDNTTVTSLLIRDNLTGSYTACVKSMSVLKMSDTDFEVTLHRYENLHSFGYWAVQSSCAKLTTWTHGVLANDSNNCRFGQIILSEAAVVLIMPFLFAAFLCVRTYFCGPHSIFVEFLSGAVCWYCIWLWLCLL